MDKLKLALSKLKESAEKKPIWISQNQMSTICPKCSETMKEKNYSKVNLTKLLESLSPEEFEERLPEMVEAAKSLHSGEIANCVKLVSGKPGISDPEDLCAFLVAKMHSVQDAWRFTGEGWALDELFETEDVVTILQASQQKATTFSPQILRESKEKDGSAYEVVLIEAGFSQNVLESNGLRIEYPKSVLEKDETLHMFEGALAKAYGLNDSGGITFDHLPDAIAESHGNALPSHTVGYYDNIRFGSFEKHDGTTGEGIIGDFHVLNENIKEMLKSAWDKGKKDLLGFSIDAQAFLEQCKEGTSKIWNRVVDFLSIPEVTLVDKPAAGGILLQLKESKKKSLFKLTENEMKTDLVLGFLKAISPDLVKGITEASTDEDKKRVVESALKNEAYAQKIKEALAKLGDDNQDPAPTTPPQNSRVTEGVSPEELDAKLDKFEGRIEDMLNKAVPKLMDKKYSDRQNQANSLKESETRLRESLKASGIPDHLVDDVMEEYKGQTLPQTTIEHITKVRKASFEKLKESKAYVPHQTDNARVTLTKDEEDKIGDGLTGMILGRDVNNVPAFRSLRESFEKVSGFRGSAQQTTLQMMNDLHFTVSPRGITGNNWRGALRESRLSQSHTRLTENLMTSTLWAEVLGDSIHRAVLDMYKENSWSGWRDHVSEISSASDFKTMRRIRVGGFADLSDVPEAGTYQEQTWPSDDEESFAVGKKGNLFPLTEESIRNDDLSAFRKIFRMIALSSARSIYKTVLNLIQDNPTMGDGFALFSAQHNNFIVTSLTHDNLNSGILLMHDQTEGSSGEVLGNMEPKNLLMPNELYATAWELTEGSMSQKSGRNETIENIFNSKYGLMPHRIPTWTDANDWVLTASSREWDTIEISFLDGRQEPEILVQDQKTVGSYFTADQVVYKARIIFAAKVLDFRPFVKAIVP